MKKKKSHKKKPTCEKQEGVEKEEPEEENVPTAIPEAPEEHVEDGIRKELKLQDLNLESPADIPDVERDSKATPDSIPPTSSPEAFLFEDSKRGQKFWFSSHLLSLPEIISHFIFLHDKMSDKTDNNQQNRGFSSHTA